MITLINNIWQTIAMDEVYPSSKSSPYLIHNHGMSDLPNAGIEIIKSGSSLSSDTLSKNAVASPLAEIDQQKGFPPRLKNMKNVKCVKSVFDPNPLTRELEDHYKVVAMNDDRVKSLLNGRWEHLSIHQIFNGEYDPFFYHHLRISFLNYTEKFLIEVIMCNDQILQINKKASHLHPEAAIEIEQAINLAKGDQRISEFVKDLIPQAILVLPKGESDPLLGHRVFHVTFTKQDDIYEELPIEYHAVVDLNIQEVLAAGKAKCPSTVT